MAQHARNNPGHPPPNVPGSPHSRLALVALVLAGGVLGTLARYGISLGVPEAGGWPLPTLLVNLGGSFLLGVLLEALAFPRDAGRAQLLRLGAGTGFLGAFTTYSTFAFDAVNLLDAGRIGTAAAYVSLSLLGGISCAAAGIAAASHWCGKPPTPGLTAAGPNPAGPGSAVPGSAVPGSAVPGSAGSDSGGPSSVGPGSAGPDPAGPTSGGRGQAR